MAGTSLLALLDDVASLLDDVAVLSKVAMKKTAGVLGDDLALNAEQVAGVDTDRELPVVWAVAKGSLVNKAILVPAALVISALLPSAITPLLMLGGLFLCYEGCEKLAHSLLRKKEDEQKEHAELLAAVTDPKVDLVAFERDKIKGAIRTDFILSAEIIVIALGTVAAAPPLTRVVTLTAIAAIMTVGVYGLVAAIVKLDDGGLYLMSRQGKRPSARLARVLGAAMLQLAPRLMRFLSAAGMVAMFLVGGGIVSHGIAPLHHALEESTSGLGAIGGGLVSAAADGLIGLVAGSLVLAIVTLVARVRTKAS